MSEFELILAVDALTPEQEDAIYAHCDALISSHGDSTRLTVTAEGTDVLEGAHKIFALLASLGVGTRRMYEDFVTRGDIAQRAGVSRQAVGLWVRGERLQESPFPGVYSTVGGGIWLWGEVDGWLRENVTSYAGEGIDYPSRMDYLRLNMELSETSLVS